MSGYTPTWEAESKSEFDGIEDYPDGFVPEHYQNRPTDERSPPAETSGEPKVRPPEMTWGEERHPSFQITKAGEFFESFRNPVIHRCADADEPRYHVAVGMDDPPAAIWDAHRNETPLDAYAYGTRKCDTDSWDVEVSDITHTNGGVVVKVALPPGEHGTLYRWKATGCLVCKRGVNE